MTVQKDDRLDMAAPSDDALLALYQKIAMANCRASIVMWTFLGEMAKWTACVTVVEPPLP